MIISFKKVIAHNFLSLGDVELKLDNQGYTLISGINNNPTDNASSNGSGKSAMFSAISYALTGETLNGLTRNLVNINTNDGMYVALEFDVDTDHFKIIRSKDHKEYGTNLRITINNEDKSGKGIRDSEKLLAEYLPDLTSSLLASVIILGQGLPQKFSSNTPAGRKEILEKLTKSDFMIDDIKQRISQRKEALSNDLRKVEDKLLELVTNKRTYERLLEQNNALASELKLKPDFDAQLSEINIQLENTATILSDIKKCREEYTDAINETTNQLIAIDSQAQADIDSATTKLKEDLAKVESQLNEKTISERTLAATIRKYKNVTDICPTCGQKLPDVHKIDTSDLELEDTQLLIDIKNLSTDITEKKNTINTIENNIKNTYRDKKLDLNSLLTDLRAKNTRLNSDELNINNNISKLNIDKTRIESERANFDNKVAETEANIKRYTDLIKNIDADILYYDNVKQSVNDKTNIINKISTIATRDFRGFLLSNIITFIDTTAKQYALDVFDNEKICFELDGNNISIMFDNKPIENLSGGERQKIDLIIQFAIRDMLCQCMGFSSNILVIDEAFDFLDPFGCQKVVDMMSRKLSDVESVFIISHHKDLSLPVDNEITIIKNSNGISEIC